MCTTILQTVFMILIIGAAGLTIASLVTPAWHAYVDEHGNKDAFGFFVSCTKSNGQCSDEWKNAPDWKKASMACLILSLAACAAGFIWSCIACFMCCCKSCLTPPLPIFAGLACLLDIIGVTIYGVKSGDEMGNIPTTWGDLHGKSTFGYSFWVGIGAIATLFVDTLVGILLVKTSKISPI